MKAFINPATILTLAIVLNSTASASGYYSFEIRCRNATNTEKLAIGADPESSGAYLRYEGPKQAIPLFVLIRGGKGYRSGSSVSVETMGPEMALGMTINASQFQFFRAYWSESFSVTLPFDASQPITVIHTEERDDQMKREIITTNLQCERL